MDCLLCISAGWNYKIAGLKNEEGVKKLLHETTKVTIQNLLTVKSLVTLMLTVVFAALSIIGKIDGKDFLNIFQIVVVFYFGTQYQKAKEGDTNG